MLRQTTSSVPIFANGAISAAFVYLFNELGDNLEEKWAREEWRSRGREFAKYGNYSGPGHAGNDAYPNPANSPYLPIDRIDAAAYDHDVAYYNNGIEFTWFHSNPLRRSIDVRLLQEVNSIDQSMLIQSQIDYIENMNIVFAKGFYTKPAACRPTFANTVSGC